MSVKVGKKVKNFSLQDGTGAKRSLKEFAGQNIVVFFYPKDNTPGCTAEACDFRDAFDSLRKRDVVILGISPDTVASHQKFADKFELPFPLLSDPEKKVAEQFGVFKEKNMYGKKVMGIERSTFILDSDGVLLHEMRKVRARGHVAKVLEVLDELESGE